MVGSPGPSQPARTFTIKKMPCPPCVCFITSKVKLKKKKRHARGSLAVVAGFERAPLVVRGPAIRAAAPLRPAALHMSAGRRAKLGALAAAAAAVSSQAAVAAEAKSTPWAYSTFLEAVETNQIEKVSFSADGKQAPCARTIILPRRRFLHPYCRRRVLATLDAARSHAAAPARARSASPSTRTATDTRRWRAAYPRNAGKYVGNARDTAVANLQDSHR